MRPPTSTHRSKTYFLNPIIIIGLFAGILITTLIWLKVPNTIITPLSWLCLGLIGSGSFWYFRQSTISRPPWIMVLAMLAAVSLVYLFPELFGPACGGMPRAFALDCPPECQKEKCIHWEAGPSEACPKPGKGGGCCLEYKTICDSDCEPPPPPDQPPTITGTITCSQWGENSWCVNNATLELIATEPQGKQLQISGNVGGTPFACPAGNGSISCSVPLPEGAATVNYLATSITGLTVSGSKPYQYDASHPNINGTLNGIAGANGWFITSVDINASASDPVSGSGISTFEYNRNNGGWNSFPGTLSLTDGAYSLSLRASDVAGNVVETNQTIQVDTITPTLDVSVVGTVGSNGWYTSDVQINVTGNDSGSGVSSIEYELNSSGWLSYSTPLNITDGVHNLSLRVIDNAGNLTEGTQTFLIDTVTPAVDLSLNGIKGANGWYNSAVQVSASASDSGSGLSALEVSVDSGAWSVYSTPLELGDGLHTFWFHAIDLAGNLVESALQQIQVDTIPPVIVLPESWELGEIAAFELQDDGSGLASVRLVIEDEDERYPKVTWDEGLGSYQFKGDINWDGRFKDGQLASPGGEYYAWLKVSDNAGNESKQAGQITVPLGSFMEELILPPGNQNGNLVSGTEASESIVISPPPTSSGDAPAPQPPATNALPPISFGGRNNGAAQPSSTQTGKVSFNAGGPSNSPATNSQSNLLWGATATAAIGAFAAEIARRKAEEEARATAKVRANERQENRASSDFRQKAKASKMAQLEANWAAARQEVQLRAQIARAGILGKKEMEVELELEMRSLATKAQAQQEPAKSAKQKAYDAYRAQEVAAHNIVQPAMCTPENIEKSKPWWETSILDPLKKVITKIVPAVIITAALGGTAIMARNVLNYPHVFDDARLNVQYEWQQLTNLHPRTKENTKLGYLITHPLEGINIVYDTTKAITNSAAGYFDATWQQHPLSQAISFGLKNIGDNCPEGLGEKWYRRCDATFHFGASLVEHPVDTVAGIGTALIADPVAGALKFGAYSLEYNNPVRVISDLSNRIQENGWENGIKQYFEDRFELTKQLVTDPQVQALGLLALLVGAALIPGLAIPVALGGGALVVGQTAWTLSQVDKALQAASTQEEAMNTVTSQPIRRHLAVNLILLALVTFGVFRSVKEINQFRALQEALPTTEQVTFSRLPLLEQARLVDLANRMELSPKALEFYLREIGNPGSSLSNISVSQGLELSSLVDIYGEEMMARILWLCKKADISPYEIATRPIAEGQSADGWILGIESKENPVNHPRVKLNFTEAEIKNLLKESIVNPDSNVVVLGYGADSAKPYFILGEEITGSYLSLTPETWMPFENARATFWTDLNMPFVEMAIENRKIFIFNVEYDVITDPANVRRFSLPELRLIELEKNNYVRVKVGEYDAFIPSELLDTYEQYLHPSLLGE